MDLYLQNELNSIAKAGQLRHLYPAISKHGAGVQMGPQQSFIQWSSNDYLGMSGHPHLVQTAQAAVAKWGIGSGGSRLLGGDSWPFHHLEAEVAILKGHEAALVFGSGYQANVGLLSAILTPEDGVFADKYCHASLLDGIRLSGAKLNRYAHQDLAHLETLLEKNRAKFSRAFIVTESVFSMDGTVTELEPIIRLKTKFKAHLVVDEAHAFGVYGEKGEGCCPPELASKIDWMVGTFGKAIGTHGAFVSGSKVGCTYLMQRCRSWIFTTALPPVIASVTQKSIQILHSTDQRQALWKRVGYLKEKLQEAGFSFLGQSHIVPIVIGDEAQAVEVAHHLQQAGHWVQAVRYPTVPKGSARIRIVPNVQHTFEEIDRLLNALRKVLKEKG